MFIELSWFIAIVASIAVLDLFCNFVMLTKEHKILNSLTPFVGTLKEFFPFSIIHLADDLIDGFSVVFKFF